LSSSSLIEYYKVMTTTVSLMWAFFWSEFFINAHK
jgi:hypothetical protein